MEFTIGLKRIELLRKKYLEKLNNPEFRLRQEKVIAIAQLTPIIRDFYLKVKESVKKMTSQCKNQFRDKNNNLRVCKS